MRQRHITNSCACSPLVLLHLVLFLQFVSPPWQFRINIKKFALLIRFSVICIFYDTTHFWLHTHRIDVGDIIEKLPRPSFSLLKIFRYTIYVYTLF